jgi:hypothetical protein
MDVGTITTLRQCEHCAYFRPEELNTGFCQFHDMYVLIDFDCERFEQRRTRAEGGDGLTGSQNSPAGSQDELAGSQKEELKRA